MSEEGISHQGTPLAEMLDPNGRLNLPPGFRGSLHPQGWKLASGEGEAPRSVPQVAGDEKWVAGFGPNGVNGDVWALVTDGSGNIYVGGIFGAAGGVAANNIAKWNGSSWSAFGSGIGPGPNAAVYDLTVQFGASTRAGAFRPRGTRSRRSLASIGTASSPISHWSGDKRAMIMSR